MHRATRTISSPTRVTPLSTTTRRSTAPDQDPHHTPDCATVGACDETHDRPRRCGTGRTRPDGSCGRILHTRPDGSCGRTLHTMPGGSHGRAPHTRPGGSHSRSPHTRPDGSRGGSHRKRPERARAGTCHATPDWARRRAIPGRRHRVVPGCSLRRAASGEPWGGARVRGRAAGHLRSRLLPGRAPLRLLRLPHPAPRPRAVPLLRLLRPRSSRRRSLPRHASARLLPYRRPRPEDRPVPDRAASSRPALSPQYWHPPSPRCSPPCPPHRRSPPLRPPLRARGRSRVRHRSRASLR